MSGRGRSLSLTRVLLVLLGVGALIALPAAAGAPNDEGSTKLLEHVSSSVAAHYYAAHPDANPFARPLAEAKKEGKGKRSRFCESRSNNDVFNCDVVGLPQNEESIASCTVNTDYVLGGTNDYRGNLDPQGNSTGWHWSTDGGKSVRNEGLLPPVRLISDPNHQVPSGGDPVDFLYADAGGCHAFAASLAYDPVDPFGNPNGVAIYRSEPSILSSCPGGSDPSCWPTRRLIIESDVDHFLDKEWFFVGNQNGVPFVWVTYSDFDLAPANAEHEFEASIKAVRCNITLTTCTGPIQISTVDDDVQFSDVTIGPDGRAYITWSRIDGELEGTDQVFTHKIRVETAPGSAVFGPEHVIYREERAIPFGGFLQANDFRIATYPKSDVARVDGHPRIFVVWDACKFLLLGFSCERPEIKLSYSDNQGVSWQGPFVISKEGVSYFPSISVDRADPSNKKLSVAWFTNSFDPSFWNAQDVVLVGLDTTKSSYGAEGGKRLTGPSNESEADPLLGGFFIGDYIEVAQVNKRAFVHYNANYRQLRILGEGFPVNQQDNYLKVTGVD
jgi:hypothetical protein